MAPKKKSPLEKMREKTKIKSREARAVLPGSAFDIITEANATLNQATAHTSDTGATHSKPSATSVATPMSGACVGEAQTRGKRGKGNEAEVSIDMATISARRTAKKRRRASSEGDSAMKHTTTRLKATPTRKAVEKRENFKEIESWQPAGGEQKAVDGAEATSVLGIARIAAWRLDSFKNELEELMDTIGGNDVDEIIQYVIVTGGERIADVYVRFGSKLTASIMRQSIYGKMIGGRRLRIYYAAE
ncbi:hypothetical protein AC578_801 [Pseudocercospora eumusae]|uniref:Uncharacterized protein n=1 Tax=Pseudocercospora eumusae TaxID=321146 RepID=A0A139HC13_9PEZI|nr:hypothetical protein AC578_801 [Pseudocercospora eumusae]